jgi:hypothetical protein
MSPLLGHSPSLWVTHNTREPTREPSANWWVLTANAAVIKGLRWLSKYGGAQYNKFLITHLKTLCEGCLTFAIARQVH